MYQSQFPHIVQEDYKLLTPTCAYSIRAQKADYMSKIVLLILVVNLNL